jgi:putative acetyltransferase
VTDVLQRRRIMTRLGRYAIDTCSAMNILRVYAEASITARPLFEKLGFRVIRQNIVPIKGVELINYSMERLQKT